MAIKVATNEAGMEIITIMAFRRECRNSNITTATRIMAKNRSCITESAASKVKIEAVVGNVKFQADIGVGFFQLGKGQLGFAHLLPRHWHPIVSEW